jgi:hypothetical protein
MLLPIRENIVTSDKELISHLGGPGELAKRLGYSVQRVQNWTTRGIPASEKLKHPEILLKGTALTTPPSPAPSSA